MSKTTRFSYEKQLENQISNFAELEHEESLDINQVY